MCLKSLKSSCDFRVLLALIPVTNGIILVQFIRDSGIRLSGILLKDYVHSHVAYVEKLKESLMY